MKQDRTMPSTDRAELMRIGAVAGATGRSRRDIERSLMVGDVVGLPTRIAQNVNPSFRAELQRGTMLSRPKGSR